MWDELYQRHYGELLRYAASVCRDEQLAEDVAQEVFLKALQNADTFEDLSPSQRRGWLYRALKNHLVDRFRRAKLENEYCQSLPQEASYCEPGLEQVESRLLLASLSDVDRAMFHLRYEEGYTAAEIAQMLGVPPGTVRSRLSRCRTFLKKQLTENGGNTYG